MQNARVVFPGGRLRKGCASKCLANKAEYIIKQGDAGQGEGEGGRGKMSRLGGFFQDSERRG